MFAVLQFWPAQKNLVLNRLVNSYRGSDGGAMLHHKIARSWDCSKPLSKLSNWLNEVCTALKFCFDWDTWKVLEFPSLQDLSPRSIRLNKASHLFLRLLQFLASAWSKMRLIQNFDVCVCSSPLFLWQDSDVCVRNHLQNWKEEMVLVCSCRNFDRISFTLKHKVWY